MTTVDATADHLDTEVADDAVQRTVRDTAEVLSSVGAVLQKELVPHVLATQIQQSSMMQLAAQMERATAPMRQMAAEMQRVTAPMAALAAEMERVTAPIHQMMAKMQAALAPLAKMMAQRSEVFALLRKIREMMPTFLGAVVVRGIEQVWHLRPWTLVPHYLRPQAAPRSTHPRGPMKARAPGALQMILNRDIRRECLAM